MVIALFDGIYRDCWSIVEPYYSGDRHVVCVGENFTSESVDVRPTSTVKGSQWYFTVITRRVLRHML